MFLDYLFLMIMLKVTDFTVTAKMNEFHIQAYNLKSFDQGSQN